MIKNLRRWLAVKLLGKSITLICNITIRAREDGGIDFTPHVGNQIVLTNSTIKGRDAQ